jgi:hypothetical protein
MALVRVESILTTTHPVEAYGGVQLSRTVLERIAEAMKGGTIPLQFDHDLRRPFRASVVDAGVRPRADGFEEAWALLEVEQQDWDDWQSYLREQGAPGGMSFGCSETLDTISGISQTTLPLSVAADAAHFPDETILEAAQKLSALGPTTAGRYYQFAFAPTAKVVLEYGMSLLSAVPPAVLSNYVESRSS